VKRGTRVALGLSNELRLAYKASGYPTTCLFLSYTQSSALDTPCWAPLTEPILFEEYLDFTSGYQDPPFIIPKCSQTPTCSSSQARPSASSGDPANSVHAPDAYGSSSQSINWDFALFSTTDADSFVPEPSSLPLSSSAALTGSLTSPPTLLNYPSWDSFSLPSGHDQYLGNDSQLLSGGSIPFPTSGDALDAMAITTGTENLHNGHFSTPMLKGMASAYRSSHTN
jgi:hypothetical protein